MSVLALDFGGTKHSAAIPDAERKKWAAFDRVYAPPGATADTDLQIMVRMADALLAGRRPDAIGVSFGGPVDFPAGKVRLSHHVPGWDDFPLAEKLSTHFSAPVAVDNDANVAALGEANFGAGAGCSSLLYITVSTGVGGGWILDGKPWRGFDGMAGEIGHTVVDPQGPLCLCGKHGCLERLASGPYMAQDARRVLVENPADGSTLRRLCGGDLQNITGQMVSQAAGSGDVLAQAILTRGARALGVAIGNAANLMNHHRTILGGGVTRSGAIFWDTLRQSARETALPQIQVEILPAALGDDAPLWGAVALADQLLREKV
jgi:glucokinase